MLLIFRVFVDDWQFHLAVFRIGYSPSGALQLESNLKQNSYIRSNTSDAGDTPY